jgi:hypothetical protein
MVRHDNAYGFHRRIDQHPLPILTHRCVQMGGTTALVDSVPPQLMAMTKIPDIPSIAFA